MASLPRPRPTPLTDALSRDPSLQHIVRSALHMGEANHLSYGQLKAALFGAFDFVVLGDALKRHDGHIENAAKELSLHRQSLEYIIKKRKIPRT